MDHFCPSYFALLGPLEQARLAETVIPARLLVAIKLLSERKVNYLLGGDLARMLYGVPATTAEAELLAGPDEREAEALLSILGSAHFRAEEHTNPDLPERARTMDRRSLLFSDEQGYRIRVFLKAPVPFNELLEGSVTLHSASWKLRLLSLEDMARMRSVAPD